MASFLKRNGKWQARIQRRGTTSVAKSFVAKADAIAWARKIEAEMDRGTHQPHNAAERMTLTDALTRYEGEVTPAKKGATQERYRLGVLKRSRLASLSLARIRGVDLAKYRDERAQSIAANTIKNELNLLSAVFEVARVEWGIGVENPVRAVKRPKAPPGRDRRLFPGEEAHLIAACKASRAWYLPAFVRLAIETGMRLGEMSGLRWERIDLSARVAHLPDTKNGSKRDVPLSTAAIEALQALPRQITGDVFPVHTESIKQAFRATVKRARKGYEVESKAAGTNPEPGMLVDLHAHDLRHEAVSRLFERGLNVMEVSAVSGHKTLAMLQRYTHLKAEDLARKLG